MRPLHDLPSHSPGVRRHRLPGRLDDGAGAVREHPQILGAHHLLHSRQHQSGGHRHSGPGVCLGGGEAHRHGVPQDGRQL